ncbi:MAG TPA: hypothetical protein VN921_01395 [Chthoniobacterales bacterium]|nr:hypothetical protein [Chthoniobacterales bacterium]
MNGANPAPASDSEIGPTITGCVNWYRIEKNFGFLTTDAGMDVFFNHAHVVYDCIRTGSCYHNQGICVRALSLLPEQQQPAAMREFSIPRFERLLKGARVTFRIVNTERGPEARSVKRAER